MTRDDIEQVKLVSKKFVTIVDSPNEADAQLAYLAYKGLVDAIITEESDLIVYGCPIEISK